MSTDQAITGRTATSSSAMLWAGRIVGGVMKLFKPSFVVEATTQLGFPESVIVPLGAVLTASTLLYLIPRTSVLGAILLTGYLGGAVASQVRLGEGWFPALFPIVFAALVWGSIWLRDERLRALLVSRR